MLFINLIKNYLGIHVIYSFYFVASFNKKLVAIFFSFSFLN
jgi:hypothetical protein